MEAADLESDMSATLTAADCINNIRPVPSLQAIILTLHAIKDAVDKARWCKEECQRLSERCQILLDLLKQDEIRLHRTGLLPARETATILLQMTTGDGSIKVIRQLQDYPAERSEDVTQRLNQVAQLLNACHESCGPLEDVPVERLQRDANASVELLRNMQEVMGNDDANLQIGGTRVNRMQFNAVYKDIMACLYKARVEAGVKLEVRNFKKEVWADEYDIFNPCDGAILSQLFIGWLHQKERVMIKCYRLSRSSDEAAKDRLLSQIKEWSQFRHPRVHTYMGITDNYFELASVSAFYEQGNIMRYTRLYKRKNKYRLLSGVVEGLIYLHEECNVCHGNRGSSQTNGDPLVADFQATEIFPELAARASREWANGTRSPRWTAVEIIDKGDKPTFKSDIWSVGMLMLEVLTGFVPFHLYRRKHQVMLQVSRYGLRPSRPENNKQISDDAWKLMEECWATDPEDRPALRDVHARLLKLDAWWEEVKPEPEEQSFMSKNRNAIYMFDD
ncbi:hypothetical protein PHLGIDRAFT_31611 [Phlebiopsis gigantea 11061_1 CR5-6]|uniref:Protein kinase domain-containing protein n=1 Tax=Phlebiopsis gigantea (strain 11061_1 CR5-6) TaxID=745531 RepID=A0A0C3PEM4_PHLG1|nr:hypothetical protein PHLGIDRAFT_31611 [Phlebiopsis gigantea 11061_1 CR5-6]